MKRKLRTIDLFAGCGGLTDGFKQTGMYDTLACVEWEKEPCRSLVNRLKDKWGYADAEERVLRFDIQKTDSLLNGWKNDPVYGSSVGLKKLVGDEFGVDAVIGGPPCQAYSLAGRIRDNHGMQNDYRNYLFESYVKVVKALTPPLFVFENVPGMLTAAPGGTLITDRVRKAFDEINYEIVEDIRGSALFDLTEYGIPQRRQRVILVGLNRACFRGDLQEILADFYKNIVPTFKSEKKVSVGETIGDLPGFKILKEPVRRNGRVVSHVSASESVPNHSARFHSQRDISIFRDLAYDIYTDQNKYSSIEEIKKLYTERTGKVSNIHKYYVLRNDTPSNTIVSHLHKDGLRHIHPDYKQARSITVREAARLQTFADDFVFTGAMGDQFKMVGNAVPPKFGEILGKSIAILLKKHGLQQKEICATAKSGK